VAQGGTAMGYDQTGDTLTFEDTFPQDFFGFYIERTRKIVKD
jgi:hypothetical protein